jgi:hypothetical protein
MLDETDDDCSVAVGLGGIGVAVIMEGSGILNERFNLEVGPQSPITLPLLIGEYGVVGQAVLG